MPASSSSASIRQFRAGEALVWFRAVQPGQQLFRRSRPVAGGEFAAFNIAVGLPRNAQLLRQFPLQQPQGQPFVLQGPRAWARVQGHPLNASGNRQAASRAGRPGASLRDSGGLKLLIESTTSYGRIAKSI